MSWTFLMKATIAASLSVYELMTFSAGYSVTPFLVTKEYCSPMVKRSVFSLCLSLRRRLLICRTCSILPCGCTALPAEGVDKLGTELTSYLLRNSKWIWKKWSMLSNTILRLKFSNRNQLHQSVLICMRLVSASTAHWS